MLTQDIKQTGDYRVRRRWFIAGPLIVQERLEITTTFPCEYTGWPVYEYHTRWETVRGEHK